MRDTKKKDNLYKEAFKNKIVLYKDYLKIKNQQAYDEHNNLLESIQVYHYNHPERLVAYYIPQGYKSIRFYINSHMGVKSKLRYFNKVCFDIGFLNKEKEIKTLLLYTAKIHRYLFKKYQIKHNPKNTVTLIKKGINTNFYNFENKNKHITGLRKFFYIDPSLTPQEKKLIAVKNTNKLRTKNTRYKIEEAIEYFLLGDEYISQSNIAEYTKTSISTVKMNLTPEDKQRIKQRNIELVGFPTLNEYTKALNTDKVIDAYIDLKNQNIKPTAIKISELTNIHRVTVSKILKTEPYIKTLKN